MEQITLQPYTLERCHQFWMSYIADPDMMDGSYKYDFNWVERYYHSKVAEKNESILPFVWRIRLSAKFS